MTTSSAQPWRSSPAHFRAVAMGVTGVTVALLFRVPVLLVFATPFVVVSIWSIAARPGDDPELVGRLVPGTVREGEAATWSGALSGAVGIDYVVAFSPGRAWIETKPASGVVVGEGIDSGTSARLAIPMRATHWGRHDIGPLNIVAVSAWGAFRWRALDVGHQLTTLPLPAVFDAAPPTHRGNGLVGLNRSGHPGDGSEFAGIRPFQTGDRLRRINWKRSLRSNELHVTATYADQDSHVALFVDALADFGVSEGIDGAASSLDTTVRAAGAVAEYFLLRGDRVSMRVIDSRFRATVPPASGQGHLRRILDVLSSLQPDPYRPTPVRADASTIPSGAMAIMLSPLISPIALQRATTIASRGLDVAVIDTLPVDVHVDDDPTAELAWRIRLLERRREVRVVQELGVPVISWRGPGSLDPFLREMTRRASAPRMARR